MAIFVEMDASGMDAFTKAVEIALQTVSEKSLKRSQKIMGRAVDQAFLNRGWSEGKLIGPSYNDSEPKAEKGGQWAKHRDSTKRARAAWSKRTGQEPAGEELRLTDDLRRAASDPTGNIKGSAGYLDLAAGEAAIGVEISEFPGAAALQWGYTPRNLVARPFLAMTTTGAREIQTEAQRDLTLAMDQVSREFSR